MVVLVAVNLHSDSPKKSVAFLFDFFHSQPGALNLILLQGLRVFPIIITGKAAALFTNFADGRHLLLD